MPEFVPQLLKKSISPHPRFANGNENWASFVRRGKAELGLLTIHIESVTSFQSIFIPSGFPLPPSPNYGQLDDDSAPPVQAEIDFCSRKSIPDFCRMMVSFAVYPMIVARLTRPVRGCVQSSRPPRTRRDSRPRSQWPCKNQESNRDLRRRVLGRRNIFSS